MAGLIPNMSNYRSAKRMALIALLALSSSRIYAQADGPILVPGKTLPGKWRASSAAATEYKDAYTGIPARTSGHSFFYEFFPDGTYRSNNLIQMTTYGCTSSIYSENSGHFHVEGDHLYIEPAKGTVKSQVCGGQPSEKADSHSPREYVFRIETTSGCEILVINGLDGKTRPDYYRRELQ